MTSSVSTLVDQTGQSNYAAANIFLESFYQYRHTLGLPASVLSSCPIENVGVVSENPGLRKKIKSQGIWFLGEQELLDFVHLAILNQHPSPSTDRTASWENSNHIVMGLRSEVHLEDPNCLTGWRRDRRMGSYHNIVKDDISSGAKLADSDPLKTFMLSAADTPAILGNKATADYLALAIGHKVFKIMMKPDGEEDVDTSLSLTQMGIDSRMAIELRRWWKQVFGF